MSLFPGLLLLTHTSYMMESWDPECRFRRCSITRYSQHVKSTGVEPLAGNGAVADAATASPSCPPPYVVTFRVYCGLIQLGECLHNKLVDDELNAAPLDQDDSRVDGLKTALYAPLL